ncbi:hypothetical protein E1301_Tti012155 [Triplophysa tibetana]|uniref:Protein FAM111A n=1 Tax=Triplophysa tibetana TaxID=1572043 RepID=A0A5A9P897_9TELE|nr:hypothetical protein E1301_Tti012155 [Triplophysa tibetana]
MSSQPKRMKQTNITTFLSRVDNSTNQTARAPEAEDTSQTSDTAQERVDKVPKKEAADEFSKDQQQDKEEKSFKYRLNSAIYSVHCDPSMTVLDALNTSHVFKKEREKPKNKDKQVLILTSKGKISKAAVKTDFPCCLIDNDEIVDVDFIKNDVKASLEQNKNPPLPSNPDIFVTFYIDKRGDDSVIFLLESNTLKESIDSVCVYAKKEETLKTALKRDGRFTNKMFQKHCVLSELGTEIRYEMPKPVKNLDQKTFKVIVLKGPKQPDSDDDITPPVMTEPYVASVDDADTRQTDVNTEQETKQNKSPVKSTRPSGRWFTPKEIPDSGEILKLLRDQFIGLLQQLKKRDNLKTDSQVQNFFKGEFAKSVESFLEVKKVKRLAELSDAVCQILVEGSPMGTGFLLFDRYVLTNGHVILPFCCTQQDPYPSIQLQKTVTTLFDFEDHQSKQLITVSVKKEVFAAANERDSKNRHLDYALLELEIHGLTNNTKLLECRSYSPPRPGSQICIVGHPGERGEESGPLLHH